MVLESKQHLPNLGLEDGAVSQQRREGREEVETGQNTSI